MFKFKRKMAALAVSALMLGSVSAVDAAELISNTTVVSAAAIIPDAVEAPTDAYTINPARFYKGPAMNAGMIGIIPPKTRVNAYAQFANGWLRVSYHGTMGYIYTPGTAVITHSSNGRRIIVNKRMNMYTGPYKTFNIMGIVPPSNQIIQVLRVAENNWVKVLYQGRRGWINLNNRAEARYV